MQKFINNFEALTSNSINASATTVDIPLADATRLGTLNTALGEYYLLTLSSNVDPNPEYNEVEIVKVTNIDLVTNPGRLTIIRGYEGTTAQSWTASVTRISGLVTKGTMQTLQAGGSLIYNNTVASFTVEKALNGYTIICDSASAQQLSLADDASYGDPDDVIPVGFRIDVVQKGAGTVTVANSGSDTTLATVAGSPHTSLDFSGQYGWASFIKTDTDEWVATGDLV